MMRRFSSFRRRIPLTAPEASPCIRSIGRHRERSIFVIGKVTSVSKHNAMKDCRQCEVTNSRPRWPVIFALPEALFDNKPCSLMCKISLHCEENISAVPFPSLPLTNWHSDNDGYCWRVIWLQPCGIQTPHRHSVNIRRVNKTELNHSQFDLCVGEKKILSDIRLKFLICRYEHAVA
jgi:hypothetical protein